MKCADCNKPNSQYKCLDCGTIYCEECAELCEMECDCKGRNIYKITKE